MSIDWPRFVRLIGHHERFLLTSHVRPDCDALGSELGMAGLLDALGKRVRIVNPQATPPNLAFIDPRKRIRALAEVPADEIADTDLLLVLDTSAWAQLGPMGEVLRGTKAAKAVLDHHLSQDDLGAEVFKDVEAEATGRLVLEAAEQLDVRVTPEIAAPLFAAVATDTGWFRFRSAVGGTYRAAGKLIDAGASPADIYNDLYEQDTLARVQLIGRVLARTATVAQGRVVHTAVFRDDFQATGALASDTEDVVNMTLTVGGTLVAVILVEQPSGSFKLSLRSRCRVDCSKICAAFGGGGHKAAAGATLDPPYETALRRVLDAVLADLE